MEVWAGTVVSHLNEAGEASESEALVGGGVKRRRISGSHPPTRNGKTEVDRKFGSEAGRPTS